MTKKKNYNRITNNNNSVTLEWNSMHKFTQILNNQLS